MRLDEATRAHKSLLAAWASCKTIPQSMGASTPCLPLYFFNADMWWVCPHFSPHLGFRPKHGLEKGLTLEKKATNRGWPDTLNHKMSNPCQNLAQFWHQVKPLGGAIPKITSLWPSAFGSLFWECPTLGLYPAHNVGPGNSIGMEIEIWWSGLRIAGEILPHVMMMWCDNWGILMMWCEQLGSYHYVECLKV